MFVCLYFCESNSTSERRRQIAECVSEGANRFICPSVCVCVIVVFLIKALPSLCKCERVVSCQCVCVEVDTVSQIKQHSITMFPFRNGTSMVSCCVRLC